MNGLIKKLMAVLMSVMMFFTVAPTPVSAKGDGRGYGGWGWPWGWGWGWPSQPEQEQEPEQEEVPGEEPAEEIKEEIPEEQPAEEQEVAEETQEPEEEVVPEETEEPEQAGEEISEDTTESEETAEPEETEVPEATAAPEETPVVEEEKEIKYPETDFNEEVGNILIKVEAPEGAFPENTGIVVTPVTDSEVFDVIKDAVEGEVADEDIVAVDISFWYEDEEIEPKKDIKVTISTKDDQINTDSNYSVVHVDNEKNATVLNEEKVENTEDGITIINNEFSVYAVVSEGSTEPEARATVNFISKGSNIATMYVKNSDTLDELGVIVYDPGVGTLEAGEMFLGWTTVEHYTSESPRKTIDGIRSELEAMSIKEGDVVNYYAVICRTIQLTYLDESGVALGSESIQLIGSDTSGDVTVNMAYTPQTSEEAFEGWIVHAGRNSIEKAVYGGEDVTDEGTEENPYKNDTVLTINGDVELSVMSPPGHWLVFDENGKGATYNAPQFVESGKVTERPRPDTEMQRVGYTFGGWYTDKECTDGKEFEFGKTLTDSITIYAKWISNEKADYTVLIWKQNIAGDGYDFAESVKLNGTVGETISTVTAVGTGNDRYARVNNVDKKYTGFHLNQFDTNVKIVTEGNAVLNVYYDRNTVTINFYTFNATGYTRNYDYEAQPGVTYYGRFNGNGEANNNGSNYYRIYYYDGSWVFPASYHDGGWFGRDYYYYDPNGQYIVYYTIDRYIRSGSWSLYKTTSGPFETLLSDNGFTWPTDYNWYEVQYPGGGAGGTRITFLDAYLPPNPNTSVYNIYGQDVVGDIQLRFYKQDPDNPDNYVLANTVMASGGNFYITDKYHGFKASQYRVDGGSWNSAGNKSSEGIYNDGEPVSYTTGLDIRFDRLKYSILYMDGVYVDGNGNPVEGYSSRGQLKEEPNIIYGSNTSSYNKGGDNYYEPTFDGFVFDGWYLDDACTHPYTFTTMPEGVTVYAKWRQIQYRVFLHPNAGTDSTLDWGSDTQEMTFRVSNGGKVSTPTGTRQEYEMIGWYTDEACTKVFNGNAFVLNETTVTTPYDKTVDMTDPMDKWGNGATRNTDLDRPWITKKLDIYAKWRAILIGADGIGVVYDANGGKNPPSDTTLYLDQAEAVAQAASTAPAGKVFKHWVVQKWNGSAYEDTETTVVPGDVYTVLKDYAKIEPKEGSTSENPLNSYTIQLRAEYADKEEPTPTHITWYSNLQDTLGNALSINSFIHDGITEKDDEKGWNVTDKSDGTLLINEAVDIRPADTYSYPGYTFLGWAKKADATENDLFLKYEDGKFYAQETEGTGDWTVEVTQVAADEKQPYDDLYAVWQAVFYVYHSSNNTVEKFSAEGGKTFNIYALTAKGYLYGGYYSAYAGASDEETIKGLTYDEDGKATDTAGTAYEGSKSVWIEEKAYAADGREMKPKGGMIYYLKEVPTTYMMPYTHCTYYTSNYKISKSWYISAIDDANYSEAGFYVKDVKTGMVKVCNTLTVTAKNSGKKTKLIPTDLFDIPEGYLTYYATTDIQDAEIRQYWITLDGITVEGTVKRIITIGDGTWNTATGATHEDVANAN